MRPDSLLGPGLTVGIYLAGLAAAAGVGWNLLGIVHERVLQLEKDQAGLDARLNTEVRVLDTNLARLTEQLTGIKAEQARNSGRTDALSDEIRALERGARP